VGVLRELRLAALAGARMAGTAMTVQCQDLEACAKVTQRALTEETGDPDGCEERARRCRAMRIACVQNGDFTQARRTFAAGGCETYKGQRYTVEAFLDFVRGIRHLVLSLDAPPHHEVSGTGDYAAVESPAPRAWVPRRFTERRRAARVVRELEGFGPTHLLVCCNDIVGCEVLQWAIDHRVSSAVITASCFRREHPPCVRFCGGDVGPAGV
jgi:hypothetical protein